MTTTVLEELHALESLKQRIQTQGMTSSNLASMGTLLKTSMVSTEGYIDYSRYKNRTVALEALDGEIGKKLVHAAEYLYKLIRELIAKARKSYERFQDGKLIALMRRVQTVAAKPTDFLNLKEFQRLTGKSDAAMIEWYRTLGATSLGAYVGMKNPVDMYELLNRIPTGSSPKQIVEAISRGHGSVPAGIGMGSEGLMGLLNAVRERTAAMVKGLEDARKYASSAHDQPFNQDYGLKDLSQFKQREPLSTLNNIWSISDKDVDQVVSILRTEIDNNLKKADVGMQAFWKEIAKGDPSAQKTFGEFRKGYYDQVRAVEGFMAEIKNTMTIVHLTYGLVSNLVSRSTKGGLKAEVS